MPERPDERLILALPDLAAWSAWLEANHDQAPGGVWLKHAKRGSEVVTVTHAEALEEAICHGWIDARRMSLDATYFLQRYTPRRPRSRWSQLNCARAARLIEAGRMRPAGLVQVQAAKQDGRWEAAYPPQAAAETPSDLQAELARNPRAEAFFGTLTGSARYAFLHRLHNVKRPEARAQRIAGYIELLNAGRTLQDR